MIDSYYKFASEWLNSGGPHYTTSTVWICIVVLWWVYCTTIYALEDDPYNSEVKFENFLSGFIGIGLIGGGVVLAVLNTILWYVLPVAIFIAGLVVYYKVVRYIGVNRRNNIKKAERARLAALQKLIEENPTAKAHYETLMKETI